MIIKAVEDAFKESPHLTLDIPSLYLWTWFEVCDPNSKYIQYCPEMRYAQVFNSFFHSFYPFILSPLSLNLSPFFITSPLHSFISFIISHLHSFVSKFNFFSACITSWYTTNVTRKNDESDDIFSARAIRNLAESMFNEPAHLVQRHSFLQALCRIQDFPAIFSVSDVNVHFFFLNFSQGKKKTNSNKPVIPSTKLNLSPQQQFAKDVRYFSDTL